MATFKPIKVEGFRKVIEVTDAKSELHAIFALHRTNPKPTLGGLRIATYPSREEALIDALRLAKGMSYKAAFADIAYSGAKSIIILKPGQKKTHALLTAYAHALNALDGDYFAGTDLGSTIDDANIILETSPYVAGLNAQNIRVDLSKYTAWGCFRGMQAIAQHLWNSPSLENKTIAIQGIGNVGYKLAEHLFWAGAHLIVCDTDNSLVRKAEENFAAKIISPDTFIECECDILAPCAMGGTISDTTIPLLQCQGIGGAANNQLERPENGKQLRDAGILYAPDYVINAGGLISARKPFSPEESESARKTRFMVDTIYSKLLNLFEQADDEGIATSNAADNIAEAKLAQYD